MEDRVSTKVVANAIPVAVSTLRDTPMNGHRPRNFTSTKLFTSTVLTRMMVSSVMAVCSLKNPGLLREVSRAMEKK